MQGDRISELAETILRLPHFSPCESERICGRLIAETVANCPALAKFPAEIVEEVLYEFQTKLVAALAMRAAAPWLA